jgi:hypothetical protein
MRLPHFRFTARRTMLLVTASAVVFAAVTYRQKALGYRDRACFHSRQSLVHVLASQGQDVLLVGRHADGGDGGFRRPTPGAETEAGRARRRRVARYHAALASPVRTSRLPPLAPCQARPLGAPVSETAGVPLALADRGSEAGWPSGSGGG